MFGFRKRLRRNAQKYGSMVIVSLYNGKLNGYKFRITKFEVFRG